MASLSDIYDTFYICMKLYIFHFLFINWEADIGHTTGWEAAQCLLPGNT